MTKLIVDQSNLPLYNPKIDDLFNRYTFEYCENTPLADLPIQRCSDDCYITDQEVLSYYRNLDYRLIDHIDYPNRVIGGMVETSFWLVTSMSTKGIQSPLNLWEWDNIHPGKKRWIIANYLQLRSVPTLNQFEDIQYSKGGRKITNKEELDEIYQNNYSAQIRNKLNEHSKLECSWHGESNRRDEKGYDNWYRAGAESIGERNWIPDYLLEHGLQIRCYGAGRHLRHRVRGIFTTHINSRVDATGDFYIEASQEQIAKYDLWQLYYHFDPRYARKTDTASGISIINRRGDPSLTINQDLRFEQTLTRPWLLYKE